MLKKPQNIKINLIFAGVLERYNFSIKLKYYNMKKKSLFILMFLVAVATAAFAQPRAVGGRLGYGFEASYQHSIGNNMVEVEVGLPGFFGVEAAATYDWIFPIRSWQEKGTWNWYAGVGAGAGYCWPAFGYVGVAGRIGVEYNFSFPLQLSFDWRPIVGPSFFGGFGGGLGVGFNAGGLYAGAIALGVRYKF